MKPLSKAILLTALAALAAFPPQAQATLPQWYLDSGLSAADTDGDGIPDVWERRTFGDPAVADSALDRDGDALTDLEEFAFGSDPRTFSSMGDGWSDLEKRGAGIDAACRIVPTVSLAQWLTWLGWDAQTWQNTTATNQEGFSFAYVNFVLNTPPYSDTNLNGTVDFWLATCTDRPAWLTVGDALTTNVFPVKAGAGRVRIRAAYGGPVTLTLDPLPGALAELPGATNGQWLCGLSVLSTCSNTVVFTDGQTPPPVSGNPDSVDGLLMLKPPPLGTVHSLTSPPPSVVLQPLRMTAGGVVLGNGGWYCLCFSDPPCAWPNYAMIGCDAVSMTMNGVTGSDPILPKPNARDIFWSRFPCLECTVTQTLFNDWHADNADISWTTNLPPPFSSITIAISNGTTNAVDPEPTPSVIGGYWHPPEAKDTYMHHDAKYEMRSKPTWGGHGHQAMYDDLGALIENPIAAGTTDISAPYNSHGQAKWSLIHWKGDVQPYIQALQLDGNPVLPTDINRNFNRPCIYKGTKTQQYIGRRPVLPTGKQQ